MNGKVRVREVSADAELDGLVWVFSNGRVIEKPRAEQAVDLAARQLAGARLAFATSPMPTSASTRYRSRTTECGTARSWRGSPEALRTDRGDRSLGLGPARRGIAARRGLCLVVAVGLGPPPGRSNDRAGRALERTRARQAFQPRSAQDELTQLGATLDGLLDRLGASLRHERRFSAELSHELRTPLARIIAEAELALRRQRRAPEYREALGDVLRTRVKSRGSSTARRGCAARGVPAQGRPTPRRRDERRGSLRAARRAVGVTISRAALDSRATRRGWRSCRAHPASGGGERLSLRCGDGSISLARPTDASSSVSRTTARASVTTSTRRSSSRAREARPDASRATEPGSGLHWRAVSLDPLRVTWRRATEIRAARSWSICPPADV